MTAARPLTPTEVDEIEREARSAIETNDIVNWADDHAEDLISTIRLQAAEITRLQSDVAELMQAANEQAGQVARLEAALGTIANLCPATQETSLAHTMAGIADAALNPNPEKT